DDGVLRHADAVVRDGQRAVLLVGGDLDLVLRVAFEQFVFGEGLEAEGVDGVAGVADQLAQEDVLVGVERVDDEVQELLQLGLELQRLGAHGSDLPSISVDDYGRAGPERGRNAESPRAATRGPGSLPDCPGMMFSLYHS